LNYPQIRTLQIGNDWFGERQGGLNRFYSELLRHLPETGVNVRGMVAGSNSVERDTAGVVTGFSSPKEPLIRRLLAARKTGTTLLAEQNTNLIAVHFALYAIPLLGHLRKVPTVVHFHGPWSAESGVEGHSSLSSRVQKSMEQLVYSRGQRLIVLSQAFQKILVERYGIPEDRVRLVPGGIDSARFNDRLTRQEARIRLGWPTDRPIVLAVRRQMKRMGLENLVDAARQVVQKVPEVLILLAGSGPLSSELQQRIAAHGLQDHVKLIGRVDDADLPTAYRAADMSVVPSQALEGFGMITLESLASGTPVLVTPVGGLPEVITPFAPECVFSSTETEVIAELLIDFLLGKRTLPSSERCRSYATDKFSWPVIARMTRDVYAETLG
jgi:glycosyltransferase involved in cell wall biosynthesis